MRAGDKVQHPDYLPPGVVVQVEDKIAIVRFAGPDGWPFPQTVRIPVRRLKRYTPPAPPFIDAPF